MANWRGIKALVICLGLLLLNDVIQAQNIDAEKSVVRFEIKKLVIQTVRGTFTGFRGEILFNPDHPEASFFSVCIDASTINTGIAGRDNHLRSKEFFNVDMYPDICFRSDSVYSKSSGYVTSGILSIAGIAKEADINFNYSEKEFLGNLKVNRFDFGLGTTSFKNTLAIGSIAQITIHCYFE